MVRIEIHLEEEVVSKIEALAKKEGRSRKKQCEIILKNALVEERYKVYNHTIDLSKAFENCLIYQKK